MTLRIRSIFSTILKYIVGAGSCAGADILLDETKNTIKKPKKMDKIPPSIFETDFFQIIEDDLDYDPNPSQPHIREFSVVITDLMLFICMLFLSKYLVDATRSILHSYPKLPKRFIRGLNFGALSFSLIGFSAITASIHHGFMDYLPPIVFLLTWKMAVYSIVALSYTLVQSQINFYLTGTTATVFSWIYRIKSIFTIIFLIRRNNFIYPILDYIPCILFILSINFYHGFSSPKTATHHRSLGVRGNSSSFILALGMLINLLASVLQQLKFSIHEHYCNHNDIYHIIVLVSMITMAKGYKGFVEKVALSYHKAE